MWLLAWSFHVTLATAFVGHLRVLTGVLESSDGRYRAWVAEASRDSPHRRRHRGHRAAGGRVALLARRVLVGRVREISTVPDFVALLLLVAVITSGDLMRFGNRMLARRDPNLGGFPIHPVTAVPPTLPRLLVHIFFGRASDPLHGVLQTHALRRLLLHVFPHQEE